MYPLIGKKAHAVSLPVRNLLYFSTQYIYPVAKLVKETHCQWSSVKLCEHDNRVIITVFPIIIL